MKTAGIKNTAFRTAIRCAKAAAVLCGLLFLWSCADDADNGYIAERVTIGFDDILGEGTKTQGDAHSGQSFSRMGNDRNFGMGYVMHVPDTLPGNLVKVIVQGWVRSSVGQSRGCIVTSTSRRDSMLTWNLIWTKKYIYEPGVWSFFKDSMFVPRSIKGINFDKIAVFAYIENGTPEVYDVDDLTITYKAE